MRLHGLGGGLGWTDTDTLPAGSNITFGVSGGPCGFATEQGVRDTLNNWASSMMTVNSVTTNWSGYLPMHLSVSVQATVTNDISYGDLKGQIISAIAAYSQAQCGGSGLVTLTDNTINATAGGGGAPPPPSPTDQIPRSIMTPAVIIVALLIMMPRR